MSAVAEWTTGQLGELCSIEIGGTPSRSNSDFWDTAKETSNRWVSIRDLNRKVVVDTAEHLSDLGVKHSNVKLLHAGTVLLSFKLSIGRVAFAGVPLYTNEAIAGLNSDKIDLNYLFHGLHQWDLLQGVDQAIKGATLNKAKLKKIKFSYPAELSEQAKIAEILSTVDGAIEQTEALIAKQQRIKTGLMQDLLTRGIDEHGNLRTKQTHKFKDSPLGRIPVEWEETQIGNATTLQRGHDITEMELQEGPYPVVSSSGIIGYHCEYTSKGPNVVVGRKGTIGKVHYIEQDLWAHDTSLYVTNFHGNNEKYFYYLFTYLNLAQYGTKSGSPSLNRNDVHPVFVALPKPYEQKQIVNILLDYDYDMDSLVANLAKIKHLKTALMQDLLTGKKRVTSLLNMIND